MARINIDTTGTTMHVDDAFDAVNAMTTELYSDVGALKPENFVRFGSGGTADRLMITGTAGFLGSGDHVRFAVRVKFSTPTPSLLMSPGLLNQEIVCFAQNSQFSSAPVRVWRVASGADQNKIGVRIGAGGAAVTTGTYSDTRHPYTLIASYDSDHWSIVDTGVQAGAFSVYDHLGNHLETVYGIGPPAGDPLATTTRALIGATPVGASGALGDPAYNFAQCDIGSLRLWSGAGCAAIHARAAETVPVWCDIARSAGATTITGAYPGSWGLLYAGAVLTIDNGTNPVFTATVQSWNEGTSTITLTAGLAYAIPGGGAATVTFVSHEQTTHIEAMLAPMQGNGAIAGVTPVIAFGGQQTAADWEAGINLGTLGNFTTLPNLDDV